MVNATTSLIHRGEKQMNFFMPTTRDQLSDRNFTKHSYTAQTTKQSRSSQIVQVNKRWRFLLNPKVEKVK